MTSPGVSILVLMDGVLRDGGEGPMGKYKVVSILVLMDGVLRAEKGAELKRLQVVSILVLMDGVLRDDDEPETKLGGGSFNPRSNGWCTSSATKTVKKIIPSAVSILVLMDGVLREADFWGLDSCSELFQSLF